MGKAQQSMSGPDDSRKSRAVTANKLRTYSIAALLVSIGLCAPGNRGYGPPWLWKIGEVLFFASLAGLAASFLWRIIASLVGRFKNKEH
jgi:hypothetical protein